MGRLLPFNIQGLGLFRGILQSYCIFYIGKSGARRAAYDEGPTNTSLSDVSAHSNGAAFSQIVSNNLPTQNDLQDMCDIYHSAVALWHKLGSIIPSAAQVRFV